MVQTTPYGTQSLAMGDAPSLPLLGSLLSDRLDHTGIPKFASASARNAALSGVTLIKGDKCYLSDTERTYVYDGSSWGSVDARIIREVLAASATANSSTGIVVIGATALPLVGTRLVQVTASVDLTADAAAGARAYVVTGSGGETMRLQAFIAGAGGTYRMSVSRTQSYVLTDDATFGVRILREGGAAGTVVTCVADLQIIDVGPAI